MALSKIADVRKLTDAEINAEVVAIKRQLFDLRLKKATGQGNVQPHQFRHLQHRQAQLLMVERERQLSAPLAAEPEGTPEGSTLAEQEK